MANSHDIGRSVEPLPPAEAFEMVEDEATEQSHGLLSEDLEKQLDEDIPPQSVTEGAEYLISTRRKLIFLAVYFALNLVRKKSSP